MMQMKTKKSQKNMKQFRKWVKKKLKRLMVVKNLNIVKTLKELGLSLMMSKPIKLRLLTIIIRPVFSIDGKFYPQLFIDDALYELV